MKNDATNERRREPPRETYAVLKESPSRKRASSFLKSTSMDVHAVMYSTY